MVKILQTIVSCNANLLLKYFVLWYDKTMKIEFEKLDEHNYKTNLEIKNKLFPESNSNEDYVDYFENRKNSEYFVVKADGFYVGIIGWYDFDDSGRDAFVGWFGVLPEFQRRGIGEKAFDFIFDRVKQKGYRYLRVYTDKVVNFESVEFYKSKNMILEPYTFDDKLGRNGNFVVFTKVISSDGGDLWNDKPLGEDDNYTDL